jgi:hypothetical protein
MTIPSGAKLESDLGAGVALYDVAHLLERTPREKRRNPAAIVRLFHHHSGALGRDGFGGLAASARYVVEQREFRGPAYTYWLAFTPDTDGEGRLVVYRAQPDDVVSSHTGGLNATGIAACWQGNLGKTRPSAAQRRMAERLCLYLERRHPSLEHSFHAEAAKFGGRSKKTCPGPHVTRWVEAWRSPARALEFGARETVA